MPVTVPVANLSSWQMYEAMVTENELGGRVTPAVALENVNVGCDLIEAGFKKVGKNGTWEQFNEAIGRSVPVGTDRDADRHKFDSAFEREAKKAEDKVCTTTVTNRPTSPPLVPCPTTPKASPSNTR